ncbi:hypothetical protein OIO90_001174 [Microbotryomycetes sp. JL221]|nr:hypothetical protein OIO90_001174 [Microbotryomycetes sp. JL221]
MVPGRPKFSLHDSSYSSSPSRDRNGRETDLEAGLNASATTDITQRKSRQQSRTTTSSSSTERSRSRRRSFGSSSPHRKPGIIYEHQVYIEDEDDDQRPLVDDEMPCEPNETQPLLNGSLNNSSTFSRIGATKRTHRLSGANLAQYGSALDSPLKGPFLPLNAAVDEGRPLQRTNSILRVAGLIDDRAGEFEKYRKSDEELRKMNKKIRLFYERQNEILDGFKQVDEILDNTRVSAKTGNLTPHIPTNEQSEREEAFERKVNLAINVNFLVNILLLIAKIAIVVLSNSVSLVASTVDSAMDFLSTLIIFGTNKVIQHKSWRSTYLFPTGKKRMEPMGVAVFSVLMVSSFVQVAIESVQRLLAQENTGPAKIPPVGLAVMGATILVKFVMWAWCRSIRNSSVEALTQDAENDIVFNLFSMIFPYAGQLLHWRVLDPIGGLLLSIYIIIEWIETLIDNIVKLTGRRALPQEHQRVAYLLTRFSPLIRGVQHLSVYHAGDHYVVEVDIVLPPNTALTTAHDIGEACQFAIEQLDQVDRAFVHVDVTFNPLSGHIDRS